MAGELRIFPTGVPRSERATAEVEQRAASRAEREQLQAKLRDELLTGIFATEVYGPASALAASVSPDELMPWPDEVATQFGGTKIYDLMRRNVLPYGSLQEGVVDVVTSLPIMWLAGGEKGDTAAEQARDAIQSAWENIAERDISVRSACGGFETGFGVLENIWGVHNSGAAKDLIAPVEMRNRPTDWVEFDYLRRPRFKGGYYASDRGLPVMPELKVSFLRYGSLHTPRGRGTGEYCYPTVWAIDATMKGYDAMTERFGYLPIVVRYPAVWKGARVTALRAKLEAQWKNVLLLPSDAVDDVKVETPTTDQAYAAANASGQSRLAAVKLRVEWLTMFLQGSTYSSGGQAEGSFARDRVADSARLYRAASHASCIEAMLNRGFVRPIMQANFAQLEESQWPRCAIDATPGEDVDSLLKVFESAAKLKVRVAETTFLERVKLPMAKDGERILEAPVTPAQLAPTADAPAEPAKISDASTGMFSEANVIRVKGKDGRVYEFFSDDNVFVEKGSRLGIVRAGMLQAGMTIVETPDRAIA